MRIFMVIGVVALLIIIFQIYTVMAGEKSETQTYKVIRVEKEFEIRFYPAVTMAMVNSSVKTYKELGNSGFSKLAGYIFGGNNENKKIAMTSPVHMDIGDSISTMSFVMPSNYNKDNLPKPNNPEVKISITNEEYVAAIKFGGFSSNEKIKSEIELLKDYLNEHHLSHYGHFRYLGYNPPYQLFGRRNEIIVAVNWPAN